MIVTVRDPEILRSLTPESVKTYLRSDHWQEQRLIEDYASLWIRQGGAGEIYEVLLPLKSEFLDFPRRMAEVLQTLEIVEETSQLELLSDLFTEASGITVQGIVINIQEGAFSGRITLMGVVINKLCRIQLELREPAYELAIKAYQSRMPVLCRGTLVKYGRSFVLHNPIQFTLDLDAWAETGDIQSMDSIDDRALSIH
jgi:hypothetical protein